MHGPIRGGDFDFGGDNSNGFSFGPSSPRPSRAPRTILFFGRPMLITNAFVSIVSLLVMAIVFAGGFLFGGISDYTTNNKYLNYLKQDDVGYKQLISQATANYDGEDYLNNFEGYFVFEITGIAFSGDKGYHGSGTFVDDTPFDGGYYKDDARKIYVAANKFTTYDGLPYYQFYYQFTDENDVVVNGTTYASYKRFTDVKSLKIAYHVDSGLCVDSINTNYKLEECIELSIYSANVKSARTTLIISSIVIAAIVGGIICMIVFAIKKGKKDAALKEQQVQANVEKTQAEADLVRDQIKQKNRYCSYCGSKIPEDSDICPGCGSRQV